MISEYVDVIVIAETKLDDTFPKSQVSLPGLKAPIRLDHTAFSGGLLGCVYTGPWNGSVSIRSV